MQSGRQTDATVINIFWPWDQLLRLAGGDDKPHRMAQSGLSNVTKPEKDLSYRSTNRQRKNSSSYLLSAWGTTLLPAPLSARFRWCSHFSHGGLQWKSKKTRPGIHNTLCYEERGSFGVLTRLQKYSSEFIFTERRLFSYEQELISTQ